MKRLIQLNLLLLLISTAAAQDTQPQEPSPQPPTKILRVYDWNDLARQQTLPGKVVSMDGMSVLKIENTNDAPLVVSLLVISDALVIKKASFVYGEIKYENVKTPFRGQNLLKLLCRLPPPAPGGDGKIVETVGTTGGRTGVIEDTSNWRPCLFKINRDSFEGLPTQLELKLALWGNGTVYFRPIKLLSVPGSWWSPQQIGLIGGIGGSVIGCFGVLLGLLASKGKARTFVLATMKIFIALGILLTIAGFVAVVSSQPYAVWYALLLPGVILTLVFSLTLPSIQRRYDELEIRRMTSIDAMGS